MTKVAAQGSAEWLAERMTGIGSSDAPVVAGESPYKSAYTLWAEKTGRIEPETPDAETQERFAIGKAMEPVLVSLWERREGVTVERSPGIVRHPSYPWMLASLDARTSDRIIEAKWSNSFDWKTDEVPDYVLLQVQHQLAVTGYARADVVGLIHGRPRIVPVYRDDALIDDLIATERAFWDYVETNTEPPPDASDDARRTIARLHPRPTLDMIGPSPSIDALVRSVMVAKANVKASEVQRDELENTLRYLIGDHEGVEGEGYRVTYRTNADSTKTDWKSVAAAYRGIIEANPDRPLTGVFGLAASDLDSIEGMHSAIVPGPRFLRVSTAKETE